MERWFLCGPKLHLRKGQDWLLDVAGCRRHDHSGKSVQTKTIKRNTESEHRYGYDGLCHRFRWMESCCILLLQRTHLKNFPKFQMAGKSSWIHHSHREHPLFSHTDWTSQNKTLLFLSKSAHLSTDDRRRRASGTKRLILLWPGTFLS